MAQTQAPSISSTSPVRSPAALVEVPLEDWDRLLRTLGLSDAYLRMGYLRAACALTPAEPVLLHLPGPGGDVVFACLVRADPTDVVTPYGYGGPVATGQSPPTNRFAEEYEAWCGRRGVVSSFVLYHPLFRNHKLPLAAFHRSPLAGTIGWTLGDDDLRLGMHPHHRRIVRRAQAAGVHVRVEEAPTDFGRFIRLYEQTMTRVGADPFYFFPEGYWEALAGDVPLVRVDIHQNGQELASVLALTGPPWLHYHLGASSEAGRSLGASHLALYELASWGQQRGYRSLHLGGGVGGRNDSLYLFKKRFAPGGQLPSYVGKAVHDSDVYKRRAGQQEITFSGFFPAYRAPR